MEEIGQDPRQGCDGCSLRAQVVPANPLPYLPHPGETQLLGRGGAGFILVFHAVAGRALPACSLSLGPATARWAGRCPSTRVVRGGPGALRASPRESEAQAVSCASTLPSPPRPLGALVALLASGVSRGFSCACQAFGVWVGEVEEVWLSVSTRALHRGEGRPVCLGVAVSELCFLCPSQAISISKAINTQEAPVKEKHARRILPASGPQGAVGGCGPALCGCDHGHCRWLLGLCGVHPHRDGRMSSWPWPGGVSRLQQLLSWTAGPC